MTVRVWLQLRVTLGGHRVFSSSEDYVAVPRCDVSVPRFVVAGCSICVCCIEVSCEMLFWRSG